ncbi:glycosyltransferase [Thiorhodococcus mannitoliphagus]|uniref:Glycosyltransferase n=1 Tax=Thiorhodococcus mannitoliphagus TaxID=329406 RepID=A0A6P1E1H0_9GAMM|nr:glycosyltransferase [Thiorhodococcus mannitoliphagus]
MLGTDEALNWLVRVEAVCLPASLLKSQSAWLSYLAVPALIRIADDAGSWAGGGLAVAGATPSELACLLLLLTTDPPTRRRALDGQRVWSIDPPIRRWRVEGVFDSSYSLAIVNRRLAMALEDSGEPAEQVALLTYEQGDDPKPNFAAVEDPLRLRAMWELSRDPRAPSVALRNAWPPRVRDMRGERRVLANYAWEETGFPEAEAQDFNRVLDLITVVSNQTARFLQDAGVEVPIAVVGNGFEHLLEVEPEPLPRALPEGFRFLHISSCFPRKGVDILLEAYGRAFRAFHGVVLIIKTFPNPHNDILEQLDRYRAADPGYPKVEVVLDDWTTGQIGGLYEACQVLVAPSRGEGFGLPIAEAMLHSLPVIVTGWGGHLDFCDTDTTWLIDYRLARARTHLAIPDSLWAEPDPNHLSQLMRELFVSTSEQRQPRVERARRRVQERYGWSRVARLTRDALARVDAQPGPRPPVRVGWLSTWGSRCGIAAYSAHLTSAFESESLIIMAPKNERAEHSDAANVQRLWRLGNDDLAAVLAQARRACLDVLVIQYHWGFFDPLALAKLCESLRRHAIRVVVDLHNTCGAPPQVAQSTFLGPLNRVARILVHTVDDVARLKDWGLSANVTLLPLCVYDIPRPSIDERLAWRDASGLKGARVLATYGYLMPHKGLSQMVEALPELIAMHPKLHLLMINAWYSAAASDAELQLLRERIDALGLSEHVTIEVDYLSEADCIARLALADLIVFPYQHTQESSSAAVRMAISAERPIAVTPLEFFEDVAEVVLRLPGSTPTDLAEGLNQMLSRLASPAFERETTERVRDFAERHRSSRRSRQLKGMLIGILSQLERRA